MADVRPTAGAELYADGDLTLRDVVNQSEFGLSTIVTPPGWAHRKVVGAHSLEVDRPRPWVDADWVVLTTGATLRGKQDLQLQFVQDMAAAGASALLFGTGVVFKSVPTAMIEEAERLSMPLFEVPFDTPFRSVISFVYQSTLSTEARDFKRLTAMQRYLMDALGDDRALEEVLERLAKVCGATTGLLNFDGEVVAATATFPARASHSYLLDKPPTRIEWETAGWHIIAVPVERGEKVRRWLLAVRRGPFNDRRFISSALEATAPLITALSAVMRGALSQERATRAALLKSALEAVSGIDFRTVAHRAATLGVDFSEPVRALALRRDDGRGASAARASMNELYEVLSRRLERGNIPYLALKRQLDLIVMAQGRDGDIKPIVDELMEEDDLLFVGVSGLIGDFRDVPRAVRDAGLAVVAASQPGSSRIRTHASLDVAMLLLSHVEPDLVSSSVRAVLQPLRENPILIESLQAYFSHHLDIPSAAAELCLHPNTLRYRLERISTIVGSSLRDPMTIANLQLALMFEQRWDNDHEAERVAITTRAPSSQSARVDTQGDGSATLGPGAGGGRGFSAAGRTP